LFLGATIVLVALGVERGIERAVKFMMPALFIIMLVVFFALAIWLLPKILRAVKTIARKLGQLTGLGKQIEQADFGSNNGNDDLWKKLQPPK
jgi:choline-glycine betaine transporter